MYIGRRQTLMLGERGGRGGLLRLRKEPATFTWASWRRLSAFAWVLLLSGRFCADWLDGLRRVSIETDTWLATPLAG